jgi:hypothetical protein
MGLLCFCYFWHFFFKRSGGTRRRISPLTLRFFFVWQVSSCDAEIGELRNLADSVLAWVIRVFSSESSSLSSSCRKVLICSLICSASSFVPISPSRVAKGHCCPSAPSEPDLSLSRHPAQAHHEPHSFLCSSCLDCLGSALFSVSSRPLNC